MELVSASLTRWVVNISLAACRISGSSTVKEPLFFSSKKQVLIFLPARWTAGSLAVIAKDEGIEAGLTVQLAMFMACSYWRLISQSSLSKLEDTRMSIAGERVSLTPSSCAFTPSWAKPPPSASEGGACCFE